MNHVSLTTQEARRVTLIFAIAAMVIAILILAIRHETLEASPISTLIQSVSLSVTIVTIIFFGISKIRWAWNFPAWIMSREVVHGVWHGAIWTNHDSRAGEPEREIEIILVIQQTYLTLSISSHTARQDGESIIEAILRNAKTDATELRYIFELRRQYESENKLTSGSGHLKLLENGTRLKGHYFTDSPTQGRIELTLVSRDCKGVDCFDAAIKLMNKLNVTRRGKVPQ